MNVQNFGHHKGITKSIKSILNIWKTFMPTHQKLNVCTLFNGNNMSVWTNVVVWLYQIVNKQMRSEAHKLDWKWDRTQCSLNFFVPTAPAPVLNTRLLSPPRREVPSTPAKRRQGRRQCRDTTPLTPTSTRTLNCRASSQQLCQPSASWTHMYTCTAEAVYLHTYHSIMSCTIIELLTLNWLLLL